MRSTTQCLAAAAAFVAFGLAPLAARADECLQVGWKSKAGKWTYYQAHVNSESGERIQIHYEFHKGQLDLKAFDKEKADGQDEVVFRGRWFEGKDSNRSGKLRISMKKGKHTAQGWYTNGDDEAGPHYDFVLRDCPKSAPPAAKKGGKAG